MTFQNHLVTLTSGYVSRMHMIALDANVLATVNKRSRSSSLILFFFFFLVYSFFSSFSQARGFFKTSNHPNTFIFLIIGILTTPNPRPNLSP